MWEETNHALYGNILAGVEEVIGHHGTHYWTAMSKRLSQHFLRPVMQKSYHKSGAHLVQTATEIDIQKKISRECSGQIPTGERLFDELELLDQSTLPNSFGEALIDTQDERSVELSRLNRRKTSKVTITVEDMDSPSTVTKMKRTGSDLSNIFRQSLRKPFQRHYRAFDRNLRNNSSKDLQDLMHLRSVKEQYRKDHPIVKSNRLGVGDIRTAEGSPRGRAMSDIHEGEENEPEHHSEETEFSEEKTKEETKPLFTLK